MEEVIFLSKAKGPKVVNGIYVFVPQEAHLLNLPAPATLKTFLFLSITTVTKNSATTSL